MGAAPSTMTSAKRAVGSTWRRYIGQTVSSHCRRTEAGLRPRDSQSRAKRRASAVTTSMRRKTLVSYRFRSGGPVEGQNPFHNHVAARPHRPGGGCAAVGAEVVGRAFGGASGAKLPHLRLEQGRVDGFRRVVVGRVQLRGGCLRVIPIVGVEWEQGRVRRSEGRGETLRQGRLSASRGPGDSDQMGPRHAVMLRRAGRGRHIRSAMRGAESPFGRSVFAVSIESLRCPIRRHSIRRQPLPGGQPPPARPPASRPAAAVTTRAPPTCASMARRSAAFRRPPPAGCSCSSTCSPTARRRTASSTRCGGAASTPPSTPI